MHLNTNLYFVNSKSLGKKLKFIMLKLIHVLLQEELFNCQVLLKYYKLFDIWSFQCYIPLKCKSPPAPETADIDLKLSKRFILLSGVSLFQCLPAKFYLVWVSVWALFYAVTLSFEIHYNAEYGAKYFIYLTNWSYLLQSILVFTDFTVTVFTYLQRKDVVKGA